MEHVVFFPAPDGAPVFRRVGSLEDAVRLVEHLRNVEGVGEVAVHPLGAEVPLAFRAWYRVEVPGAAPVVEAPAVEVPAVEVPAAVDAPVQASVGDAAEPVEAVLPEQPGPALVEATANGHTRDGVSSLGFFA